MKIELIPASIKEKPVIKNLARFYVYELSRYDANQSRSKIPEDGLYEAYDKYFSFDSYWDKLGYHPFIIRVQDELAGFVLVNKNVSESDVDWHIAEFFIIAKFQGQGIGRQIAIKIFNQFSGTWEVMQMLLNKPAITFWKTVISDYTRGQYLEFRKTISEPEVHDMIVLKFQTGIKSQQ